jgi:lipopolysaccharide transport system ATP-binding protein
MPETAIRVENLSKKYVINHQNDLTFNKSLRESISNAAKSIEKKIFKTHSGEISRASREEFWALKDISFEIKYGDKVGVIGRNGAGKSTLLKILSRITEPFGGRITIRGRVASLLEVGTGFHAELTGRENIFLNGAILGMSKVEILQKFDEIVAFAEIDKFLDTPVKRYSSGMYVRLAFGVAAHLEPEILIVDEVLAVGDAQFQKKCLGKMESISEEGRTVIFVSHNMQAISTLTNTCIFLNRGQIIKQGETRDVINEYLGYGLKNNQVYLDDSSEDIPKVISVEVFTSEANNTHIHGKPLEVDFKIYTPYALNNATFAFQILNQYDQPIVHFWVPNSEIQLCKEKGYSKIKCQIPKFRLFMGKYSMNVYFAKPGSMLQMLNNICPFEVVMYGNEKDHEWQEGSSTYLDDFTWKKI